MNTALPPKLAAALAECRLHSETLQRALADLPGRFDPAEVQSMSEDMRRTMDQAACRFMKLQDTLGERVLPAVLALALDPLPPEAPFVQKLQRLERLKAVPSAEGWRLLREVRNALAHDYPDEPQLQAAAWTRFVTGARDLLAVWAAASVVIAALADTH